TIAVASVLAWMERDAFLSRISDGLSWRTVVLAWIVLALTTTAHEFAHGLTCKHFGGEVRDIGFLLIYFTPCFYANVSDAWLFPERWKRIAVTLAGGYCDLVLWSLGIFGWRLAQSGTIAHDLAFFVATICGVRVFFNLNPLLKLDGYYLLSDMVDAPNLRRRGLERFKAHARRLLWGAKRPPADPRGYLLTSYGLACWSFSMMFLITMMYAFSRYLATSGLLALGWTVFLAWTSGRRLLRGFTHGEVRAMFRKRRGRAAILVIGGVVTLVTLAAMPVRDRVGGTFLIRPAAGGRAELRAGIAGFLREVSGDEGSAVSPGTRVARLEVPGLSSKLLQKRAEIRESEARLTLLRVGPRPEAVAEQRAKVERSRRWRDLARSELERTRAAFEAEIAEFDAEARQLDAELDRANQELLRDRALFQRQALQRDALRETEKAARVAEARVAALAARRAARTARGVLVAEGELARREVELADDKAALRILEAGTRPEEIESEAARLARLQEELQELLDQESRLVVSSPVMGLIATPRLRERIGQYFQQGDLIAEVEATERVEAEVAINEQDVPRIQPGQEVALKVRALPFETFVSRVDRIAPAALRVLGRNTVPVDPRSPAATSAAASASSGREATGTFIVYCALDDVDQSLRTGMSGYARVRLAPRPLGVILAHRVLRMIRTEFWW
ncbi:MAG: efflux RND transporter periplasmic adaptor subunit, partial [Isosphaeraceae bacterium]